MRMHVRVLILALAAASLGIPAPAAAQDTIPAGLIGTWVGDARIANKELSPCAPQVRVTIGADGAVQGMVGEARLVNGRLKRNRGAVGRSLRVKTDWIVDAGLDGPIFSAESVTRERVRIPFDVRGDSLRGGFHAMGGGRTISATVVLRRP